MATILAIESSIEGCSVAWFKDNVLQDFKAFTEPKGSSARLTTLIQEVSSGIPDAVAIAKGPGSYTGLRVGLSTAKGLCFGWDVPLLGISTLDILAIKFINNNSDYLIPTIDARRNEIFFKVLMREGFVTKKKVTNLILNPTTFNDLGLNGKILFCGNASKKCLDLLSQNPSFEFAPDSLPSAKNMGELAFAKFLNNEFEDLVEFEPNYAKEYYFQK